jgi:hypothetical protein
VSVCVCRKSVFVCRNNTHVATKRVVQHVLFTSGLHALAQTHNTLHALAQTHNTFALHNTGGIGLGMWIWDTSIAVINAHFPAHQGEKKARDEVFQRLVSELDLGGHGWMESLQSFDHLIWAGDLNYRLQLPEDIFGKDTDAKVAAKDVHAKVVECIEKGDVEGLLAYDELRASIRDGQAFGNFTDCPVRFKPTFKVERKQGVTYTSQRLPAFCDRILVKSTPVLRPLSSRPARAPAAAHDAVSLLSQLCEGKTHNAQKLYPHEPSSAVRLEGGIGGQGSGMGGKGDMGGAAQENRDKGGELSGVNASVADSNVSRLRKALSLPLSPLLSPLPWSRIAAWGPFGGQGWGEGVGGKFSKGLHIATLCSKYAITLFRALTFEIFS